MTVLLDRDVSGPTTPSTFTSCGLLDAGAVDSLNMLLLQERLGEAEAAVSLRLIRQSIHQLQGLELKLIAAAQRAKVGAADGLVAAAWVARETRQGGASAARTVQMAGSLETLPHAGQALGEGLISVQHAEVIAAATKQLPPDLTSVERDRVEKLLTEQAKSVDPTTLRKVSRRAVELVGRSITEADAQENRVVKTTEEIALDKTRLSLHDNTDGTISGHFVVPTFAGHVLRKVVQQITAPRRQALRTARADRRSFTHLQDSDADWAHQYGLAFVDVLEHLPTDHLHSKVAATVVVTMDLDQLRDQLKVAGTDTGEQLSAEKARQLACNAGLIPAVFNGASVPFNLGRSSRLFSDAQRTVLAATYDSCAAVGCDRPYAWSELHHQKPWHQGGMTDLDEAIPLCGTHHRMIHNADYAHTITTVTKQAGGQARGDRSNRGDGSSGAPGTKRVRFRLRN